MQARTAARELALILFSQCRRDIDKLNEEKYSDIILKSVRSLSNNALSELKVVSGSILEIRDFIELYECDHPDNLQRPIDAKNIEVPLPTTIDMLEKLDDLLNVSEKAMSALEIAELTVLEEKEDVKKYILNLANNYKNNKDIIDGYIKAYAKGWDIDRLVKIDKDILRIAICEILYVKDVPLKVVLDEAIELAKKYSTQESASFINGILGSVAIENGLKSR